MAEVRLTPSLPMLAPAASARANDTVRAAQRAFFDAALNAAQTAAPLRTASAPSPADPSSVAPQAPAATAAAASEGASRSARPGSLLDIRV